jgi:hypothetical protein
MNFGNPINEIINIKSEDEETFIDLIFTNFGTIFKIHKMNSNPTILLLTLKKMIKKLNELEIKSVNNLISKDELNMFTKKTIKQNVENNVLIEIKTEDLFDELVNVFGIDKLSLK